MWQLCLLALTAAREFTISGMSSGAFMAVQMHFAYSEDIKSASIIAGGPYHCVGTDTSNYMSCNYTPEILSSETMIKYIEAQDKKGTIDSTTNLKDAKVFLFTGTEDNLVVPGVGKLNYAIYKNYVDIENIEAQFDFVTGHTWPSDEYGGDCLENGLSNCDYDIAEKILTVAYGDLNPRTDMNLDNLKTFDQTEYFDYDESDGLGYTGFVYIPTDCQNDPDDCRIHVNFHGCQSNMEQIGNSWVIYNGLNKWAESNDIIVIYPQTNTYASTPIEKERGCWDFWGSTGDDYTLKSGVQLKTVYEMAQDPPGEYKNDDDDAQTLLFSLCVFLSLII